MNREWVRGGVALVCVAAIGGLIYLGIGSDADPAPLLRALSLICGIVGLAFIVLGITAKPRRQD